MEDNKPPNLTLHRKGTRYLSFKIGDWMSGLKSYRATIDGKFILMNQDHKKQKIWTDTKYTGEWKGEFKLVLVDNAGNETVYKRNLQ